MNTHDLRAAAALSDAAYYNQATEMDERIAPFGWQVSDDILRGSNRALICYNDILGAVAVVFRGSANRQNWLLNLDARLDGGIHKGFKEAYDELQFDVRHRLDAFLDHHDGFKSLVITGHSLGGALACLHAMGINDPARFSDTRVITFGQPRVGDSGWEHMYNTFVPNTLRVVHALDDVPLIPGYPFKHVGQCVHLDGNGNVITAPGRWWRRAVQWIRGVFQYPKAGLLDHLLPSYISTINKMSPSWSIK